MAVCKKTAHFNRLFIQSMKEYRMSNILQFGQKDLEIIKEETVYKGHFELKRIHFRHKLFSGKFSGEVVRELLVKGEAAALIAYDPKLDNVVLVEQVRIGAYQKHSDQTPWLLELVAGMVDKGEENPAEVAKREAFEEAGIEVKEVEQPRWTIRTFASFPWFNRQYPSRQRFNPWFGRRKRRYFSTRSS